MQGFIEDSSNFGIHFHKEDGETGIDDYTKIENWLLKLVETEKGTLRTVNYIFCSDEYLYQINMEYLNHDTYTDIITFQNEADKVGGDIFISTERVKENAIEQAVSFEQELLRVLAHGLLHMCGYKDKSSEEELLMREKEDFYIKKYNELLNA